MYNEKEIYLFDIKTGLNHRFSGREAAARSLGINYSQRITIALDTGYKVSGRYKASLKNLSRQAKQELYKEYWDKQDTTGEEWINTEHGFYISSFGRVHNGYRFLFPTSAKGSGCMLIKYKAKQFNLLRLMAEKFIKKSKLTKDEIVCRRAGITEFRLDMIYISDWAEYRKRGRRAAAKPVALIDEDGNIEEVYDTLKEAAEKNYISVGGLSGALMKRKELCCGLRFKYLNDVI